MKELLYALPSGMKNDGAPWGLTSAHMAYRIVPGPKLTGVGLTDAVRGGAMVIACDAAPGGGEVHSCCRQVVGECRKRGFDRVICDFEGVSDSLEALCAGLGRACAQAGLPLYLPERLAAPVPDCRVLVSSVLTSGTLERRLGEALERWGERRVVLAVEACAEDFPLPAAGRGKPLEREELRELMARLEPAVFFDRGLCAHYFTYMVRGGQAHFILFDSPSSVRAKLDTAQRLGVACAMLAAPQVGAWLKEIFS